MIPTPPTSSQSWATSCTTATENHVRFTFALSPGNTVCYSSDADYQALVTKLQQMYDLGVRAFNIPLDDIDYGRWHCDGDRAAFGAPSARTAGIAQATFLDRVQKEFVETHEGVYPLQMVPTEYYNTTDSGYKTALRGMDEDVVVMWTGEGVVPQSVTVDQAKKAATVFGGPTFLWDNYPVNDYGQTSGRLLLAPYDKREAGLGEYLSGIVSNPMNQAAASKIAIFGVADFTWNDEAYDAGHNWSQALRYVANGDATTSAALRVFADLNHLAPSFGAPWQPQSPELAARIAEFWERWDAGDKAAAVAGLRDYAQSIADAPAAIRSGPTDPAFLSDASPWLDATALWGQATCSSSTPCRHGSTATTRPPASSPPRRRPPPRRLQRWSSTRPTTRGARPRCASPTACSTSSTVASGSRSPCGRRATSSTSLPTARRPPRAPRCRSSAPRTSTTTTRRRAGPRATTTTRGCR